MKFFALIILFLVTFVLTSYIIPDTAPKTHSPAADENEIQVDGKYLQLNIYENDEIKPIADMLSKGCNEDDLCEIENDFNYVVNLPYKPSFKDKKPEDVINLNGGDCDEKSFLFASLLLQQQHESVLIVTKEHAFIAVHVENEKKLKKPNAKLLIHGKNYYYAEMTVKNTYIGWFNDIRPGAFEVVYDISKKREIPKNEIEFYER